MDQRLLSGPAGPVCLPACALSPQLPRQGLLGAVPKWSREVVACVFLSCCCRLCRLCPQGPASGTAPGLRATELQTEPCTSRTQTPGGLGGAGAPLPASPPARFALHRPIQSL